MTQVDPLVDPVAQALRYISDGYSADEAVRRFGIRVADLPAMPAAPGPVSPERLRAMLGTNPTPQEQAERARSKLRTAAQHKEAADRRAAQPEPPERKTPARTLRLVKASSIRPMRARWLWDGRVPLGEITLIAGREGAGKSTFLAWKVRAITRGELPGEFFGHARAVLYAAAEDSWAYTVVPRLIAAGADLDLVYHVAVTDAEHGQTRMVLPLDNAAVFEAGKAAGAVVLMLDPGLSFLDDKIDTFRTPEVRPALEALRRYAERAQMAVEMLCHFNKSTGTDVLTKIAGARAFAEVARAALAVAVDEGDDDDEDQSDLAETTVILSQAKNNLGRMNLPNLTYTIRDAVVETDDGDAHVGRLHWTGESSRTAQQALNGGGRDKRVLSGPALRVVEWVRAQNRAVPADEITRAFPDLNVNTLKSTLARCVASGHLGRPIYGHYATPGPSPIGGATSATSATLPDQSVCSGGGDEATSATGDLGEGAGVAGVAGVAEVQRLPATGPWGASKPTGAATLYDQYELER